MDVSIRIDYASTRTELVVERIHAREGISPSREGQRATQKAAAAHTQPDREVFPRGRPSFDCGEILPAFVPGRAHLREASHAFPARAAGSMATHAVALARGSEHGHNWPLL